MAVGLVAYWHGLPGLLCLLVHNPCLTPDMSGIGYVWQVPTHWDSYAKIPDRCKYNYDEQAANAVKGRLPGLLSEELSAESARRVHAICADGKMGKHFTDGFFSRGDGKCKAPFAIKACGGKTIKSPQMAKAAKTKETGAAAGGARGEERLEMPELYDWDAECDSDWDDEELPKILPSDSDGLRDSDATDGRRARIGLGITRSGSMIRRLFPSLCRHFVQVVLNDDDAVASGEPWQGQGGEPVILFVDGHASRWSLSANFYLLQHNVFAFCLPSHTSMCVVSQTPPHRSTAPFLERLGPPPLNPSPHSSLPVAFVCAVGLSRMTVV